MKNGFDGFEGFEIARWDACCGSVRSRKDWQGLLMRPLGEIPSEAVKPDLLATPEYLYLSTRQRRRLSSISKMALDVAFGCGAAEAEMPAVFASRRGEVRRMARLLEAICSGDEASPTDFSLSVHNTASGLLSIQTGNERPSTAVSAGHDSLAAGLIEAVAQLNSGLEQVLLLVFEDRMPDVYQAFSEEDEYPVAAAFLLKAGGAMTLAIEPVAPDEAAAVRPGSMFTQLAALTEVLINDENGQRNAVITGERLRCTVTLG